MLGTTAWGRGVGSMAPQPAVGMGGDPGSRVADRRGTSGRHPLLEARLCPGPPGEDQGAYELQIQVPQRPLGTRNREPGRSFPGLGEDAEWAKAGWEELNMEGKGQAIRDGCRR